MAAEGPGMRLKAAVARNVSMAVPVPLGPEPLAGTITGTALAGGVSTLSSRFTYACNTQPSHFEAAYS